MGYEVDILGVGEKSNSGDAIALRYGNLHGGREEQQIAIIDSGFKDDGQRMVDHIGEHYKTGKVDLVISTHPDQDHINGLRTVIEELEVSELWIHQPWDHNDGLADKFKDGRVTDNSLSERLKENLEAAYDLVQLAKEKGVNVKEPFTGLTSDDGAITVLGPTETYYEELLIQFDGMPEVKTESAADSLLGGFSNFVDSTKALLKKIFVSWGEDKIDDKDGTSAKNNSSVITQVIVDDKKLLFTGDAGITALDMAADQIDACTSEADLRFIQVPHHGSRRNVGPSVLNRLIGEPVSSGQLRNISAIASTAKEGEPKHPHKSVLNAFAHRGATVSATRGNGIRHKFDAPARDGWTSIDAEPYHYEYDDDAA